MYMYAYIYIYIYVYLYLYVYIHTHTDTLVVNTHISLQAIGATVFPRQHKSPNPTVESLNPLNPQPEASVVALRVAFRNPYRQLL